MPYGRLAAVSCPSPDRCFAVGVIDGVTHQTKVTERWNGTAWSIVPSPNPPGAINSQLTAVHCGSSASCVAVGQYSTATATKTLIQRWNGKKWSTVPSPNPVGVAVSSLAAVRCPSAANCFAVGSYFLSLPDSSAEQTLVERWDGTSWSIVASPNKPNANDSSLAGVACPTATTCFAVGQYSTNLVTRTLVERWDGSAWSIVGSPNPGNVGMSSLAAVDCPDARTCIAVGSGRGTLVERWNGSGWSMMTSPNPERDGRGPHGCVVPRRDALLHGGGLLQGHEGAAVGGALERIGLVRREHSDAGGRDPHQLQRHLLRRDDELLRGRRVPPRPEPATLDRTALVAAARVHGRVSYVFAIHASASGFLPSR